MKNKEAIQTGERFRRWFMQYAGQFAFLIILFVVLSIASPTFRTATNLINVARQVSINMIIACAMTLVLIIGGIDLSVGAVMAMSGMVSAYLSLKIAANDWICSLYPRVTGLPSHTPPSSE